MTKEQIFNDFQKENANWEALLADIGEGRMEEGGVGGDWSMKDIITHLTGWRRWSVMRLQAALDGKPEPTPFWPPDRETDDEINAWIYEQGKQRPLQDVLRDYSRVTQELIDVLAEFPEADLADPNRFPWLEGKPVSAGLYYSHFHQEHEADIRAWLARR